VSQEVSDAFIRQYESDVFYQRMGSKLKNTVRNKSGVNGSSTTFQKVGKGAAVQKARHAEISTMEVKHDPVECVLQDWYAGDYIDKLDELKTNIDERQVVSNAGAYALGRKSDQLIISALDTVTTVLASHDIAAGGTGLTQAKIDTVFAGFGNGDIPDDGQRFAAVSAAGWLDLLPITAFSSADFIGDDQLPYKGGMTAKRWLSFTWFEFSGLPGTAADRSQFFWHKTAVGFASGQDVKSEINYVPQRVAHLATSFMSQGAVLIEPEGVWEVHIQE
jgi:hypothetical protein